MGVRTGVRTSVTYNGKMLDPFKFRIEHLPDYEISLREFDLVHVDGRTGDVAVDRKTYKNKKRTYSISFAAQGAEDFSASCSEISAWLDVDGYAELRDTYDPNYYYLAVPSGNPKVASVLNGQAGKVTVDFSCIPKKYLQYGARPFLFFPEHTNHNPVVSEPSTNSLKLYNPTMYDAKPLVVVEFNDSADATINGMVEIAFLGNSELAVPGASYPGKPVWVLNILFGGSDGMSSAKRKEKLYIDCDLENAYWILQNDKVTNANAYVYSLAYLYSGRISGDEAEYPTLVKNSNNVIRIDSGCAAVKNVSVIPRFWVR